MEKLAIHGGEPTSEKMIPIARPIFSEKTIEDIAAVLKSGHVIQGSKTVELEERFRQKVGAKYAYAVNSGTAALHAAYLSILKPGDEVIVPAFTFLATASMVVYAQGKPVFADIDPETFLIDAEDIKKKITKKTRAIVPVHLFGNAANMYALNDLAEDYDLLIVSDSAQAQGTGIDGRDIGSFDTLNCYSFYPTKIMTTGEGGMITTNDEKLYRLGCLIRNHGDDAKYHHVLLGLNYRLTDIAAAIGLNQLANLDRFLEKRRHCGKILKENISKIEGLTPQKIAQNVNSSYSYFSVVLNLSEFKCSRDEFIGILKAENIDCAVHYPTPLTKQPAITNLMKTEACPISEDISKRIFSLPMHPELSDKDLDNIIKGVEKVVYYTHK